MTMNSNIWATVWSLKMCSTGMMLELRPCTSMKFKRNVVSGATNLSWQSLWVTGLDVHCASAIPWISQRISDINSRGVDKSLSVPTTGIYPRHHNDDLRSAVWSNTKVHGIITRGAVAFL